MSLSALQDRIPDFGRDIKLNLDALLGGEAVPGLTSAQVAGIALASAYAVEQRELAAAIRSDRGVSEDVDTAAKGAASLMAMNNVYYRTMHLIEDPELAKLPARLRMNFIGKPGIAKVDFELMCLAVSAIAGCGRCVNAHVEEVRKQSITDEGIHSTIRLAAVINAARQVLNLVSPT